MHAAVLSSFLAVLPLHAQDPSRLAVFDAGTARMGQAVLGAVRLPVPPLDASRVPSAVYTLSGDELRRSGARTLQEALQHLPGVVMYDQSGNGFQQILDLRGFNATPVPATIVLVDGVRVNEPDFGQVNWQVVPIERVERIEVMPGPSTIYGKDAMAGVVNILTRRGGDALRVTAEAGGGTYGRNRQAVEAGGPAGPFDYHVSASRDEDGGYRIDSDARIHRAAAKLGWRGKRANLDLDYAWADDRMQQAGNLTAAELGVDRRQNIGSVRTDNLLHALTLGGRFAPAEGWSASGNLFFRMRTENTPLNRGRSSVSSSHAGMEGKGGVAQVSRESEPFGRALLLAGGVEFSRQETESASGGAFGTTGFSNRTAVQNDQWGLFGQASFDLAPKTLSVMAGLRYDVASMDFTDRRTLSNSGLRTYQRATPRVGLNWSPLDWLGTYVSYAEAFRTPRANELSALGPFVSTPDLSPVKARSYELGGRFTGGWGKASVALFRADVRDEIFPVFDPVAGFGKNRNIDRTRREGLELLAEPRWRLLSGFVSYSYTEATFGNDFVLDKVPFPATQQVRKGGFLPQVPRNKLGLGVSATAAGATASVEQFCVGSQHVFGDESNTEPRLGGYCVTNLGASYERWGGRFFVQGRNILDRRYETRGILASDPVTFAKQRFMVPAPGAELFAGVQMRFPR